MKIAVLTDSGSGLTKKDTDALGIFYLSLQVICNGNEYLDGLNITTQEVYDFLHEGVMPTTSMPTMGSIEELLKEIKAQGYDEVIAVPITSGLSSTSEVLATVAKQMEMPVHIVETYTTCNIQKYIATSAKQLVDKGFTTQEILERLKESIQQSNTLIIPDDLQHLKRGGRLTPLAAALGGLLKIKPVLQLNQISNGKIDVFAKVRTMSKAQQQAVEEFAKASLDDAYELTVLHADAKEEGEQLRQKMQESFPTSPLYFGLISAVISCHTGIGCLGIQYIKKVRGL
ncbi:MAG: DegV family protein [Erysipelotrichaceae bacterium]|nr:DegV family protein [Erysipelotrichaceae bacterium]